MYNPTKEGNCISCDIYDNLNEENLCSLCYHDMYVPCADCDTPISANRSFNVEGDYLCVECYEKYLDDERILNKPLWNFVLK